jgi:hypothetical protein
MSVPNDRMTILGAESLAQKIRGYWMDKDCVVATRIEKDANYYQQTVYVVRSNLINGLPAGRGNRGVA